MKQADIGHLDRAFGQAAHPPLQRIIGGIFEAGGIDHGKPQIGQPRLSFPQISGHTRLVIDQCKLLADKTVEQGGFAHVRAAHNSEGEGHQVNFQRFRCAP